LHLLLSLWGTRI